MILFRFLYLPQITTWRRMHPPTFSDTAINDRHSDTTILQLRAHLVRIFWSTRSETSFGHVPNPRLPACAASTLSTRPGTFCCCVPILLSTSPPNLSGTYPQPRYFLCVCVCVCVCNPILVTTFPEWLSGTEPLPHTPGAVRPSMLCL